MTDHQAAADTLKAALGSRSARLTEQDYRNLIEQGFDSPEVLLDARDKTLEASLTRPVAVDTVLAWQAENKPSSSSIQWRHQQVAVGDEDLEDVGGRMTRVLLASTGECIGTAARIQQDGLTVSCRHVFVDDGNFLNAIGWGEKLAFVASSPHDDIVLLQGPPGKHFGMTEKVLQLGSLVSRQQVIRSFQGSPRDSP